MATLNAFFWFYIRPFTACVWQRDSWCSVPIRGLKINVAACTEWWRSRIPFGIVGATISKNTHAHLVIWTPGGWFYTHFTSQDTPACAKSYSCDVPDRYIPFSMHEKTRCVYSHGNFPRDTQTSNLSRRNYSSSHCCVSNTRVVVRVKMKLQKQRRWLTDSISSRDVTNSVV